MVLAWEAKLSKQITWRACNKLELPGFNIDESLGEDFFTMNEDDNGVTSSISLSAFGMKVSVEKPALVGEPA